MTTLESVKLALRISTAAFDAELNTLIQAALMDMGVAGVIESDETNALILRAVITYCKMHFGQPDDYDRLKKSYDEQKAQLGMSAEFTDYSMVHGNE